MSDLESALGRLGSDAGQKHGMASPTRTRDHNSTRGFGDSKGGGRTSIAGPSSNPDPMTNGQTLMPPFDSATQPPNDPSPSQEPAPPLTQVWHFGKDRLNEEVHPDDAIVPLTWQSLLTGLVDSILFSSAQTWVGFITGDFVQFSMNLAQHINPHTKTDGLKMLLRGMAISGFFIGSYLTGVLGHRMGWRRRQFLIVSALVQSALIWVAVGIALSRPDYEEPTIHWWPPILFMSAMSMGFQSATSQNLGCAAFSTSVAFTATVSSIGSDPRVCQLWPLFSRDVRQRDLRILSMLALCIGAGIGESLLLAKLTFGRTLAVAATAKLLLVPLWWLPHGRLPA